MNRIAIAAWVGTATAVALAFVGGTSNIDPDNKFAWGENAGWLNWRDANAADDGVVVAADHLAGFIWGENTGWIDVGDGNAPYANIDDTNFGVNIDGNGDLDGFGWGENVGWLNFGWADATHPDRPRLDDIEGRFRGWVWGENIGWINLDDDEHFVATDGGLCVSDTECLDINSCTCDTCDAGTCISAPTVFGNVNCDPGDVVDLDDILCTLAGFSVFDDCPNADISPCGGNGLVDLDDILSVIAAFGGSDECGCNP